MNKIRVLLLNANPMASSRLQLDEEVRLITEKVRMSEHRDAIELCSAWAVRSDDLLDALNRYRPEVVHFSCHGTSAGEILLLHGDGRPNPVNCNALSGLFRTLKDNVRVVLVNSCFSEIIARSLSSEIDCPIGMNREIGDVAARVFASAFYRALGYGRSVQNAYEQGLHALALEGLTGVDIPRLLVRPGIEAAKVALLVSEDGQPSLPLVSRLRFAGSTLNMVAELKCEPKRLVEVRAHPLGRDTIQMVFDITNSNAFDMSVNRFYIDLVMYDDADIQKIRYFLGAAMANRKYRCMLTSAVGRYACIQTSTDFDYIRLSHGEMERFWIELETETAGIYGMRLGMEYSIGGNTYQHQLDDDVQFIGFFDMTLHQPERPPLPFSN